MLDQLRNDITTRLDELLGEADKLRRALTALGTRHTNGTASNGSTPSAPRRQTARSKSRTAGPVRKGNSSPATTATKAAASPARKSRSAQLKSAPQTSPRTAPGATKSAVLMTLASGDTMTAGEVAAAAGLGRATVSTTLSRLAKTGDVTKANRGYQITPNASAKGVNTTTAP
jgi:hypothetical protein